jgi:hypothetical protein
LHCGRRRFDSCQLHEMFLVMRDIDDGDGEILIAAITDEKHLGEIIMHDISKRFPVDDSLSLRRPSARREREDFLCKAYSKHSCQYKLVCV